MNAKAVVARAAWIRYFGFRFVAVMACQALALPFLPGLLADAAKGSVAMLPFMLTTILLVIASVAAAQGTVAYRHGIPQSSKDKRGVA